MTISRRRFIAASAAMPLFAPSLALAQAKELRLGLITPNGHSWNKAALQARRGPEDGDRRPTDHDGLPFRPARQ